MWIGSVRFEKFLWDFVARTLALIAPSWPILHRVSCSSEMVPNAPKRKETHQKNEFRVQWCGSGAFVLKKFLQDIVALTFALIAPVWRILQQVLCSSETVPNAPKWKETHENLSLGSNCVDRERPFREILMRLCGTNTCINCTKLAHFAPSFVQLRNGSKCTQTERNAPKMSLGSNGVDLERSLWRILTRHRCTNFCSNCTSLARFAPSFVQ